MPIYRAPTSDSAFLLRAVGNVTGEELDTAMAVLAEAAKFAQNVLQPLNSVGDREGCTRAADGSVRTPPGFRQAFAKYVDAGWPTLAAPAVHGGQGLVRPLCAAVQEYWVSANMGFAQYSILTNSAIALILAAGSDEQKRRFLPNLVSGRWTGAMSLTEAQCGTDLGLIQTRARETADGTYHLKGTKIFISAGEHDLTENIVHMVLARIDGAAAGTAGLSLFIVPKVLSVDGQRETPNRIHCSSLEHKMGLRASATCVLHFDDAIGYLVGEPNQGLASMFVMMNETRLTTGIQGVAIAEVAYQNAAEYAKERLQGRGPRGPVQPERVADPLLVHMDVRRMLLDIRTFVEGARALVLWCASLVDTAHGARSQAERSEATSLVSLLTPVIKAYLSDRGFECAVSAQQVFGGHGYITGGGMEQFVRDARISQIYEGANGIQAMDLVGRKLLRDRGRAFDSYAAIVSLDSETLRGVAPENAAQLDASLSDAKCAARYLLARHADPEIVGAAAYDFLNLMGLLAIGHMWAKQCLASGCSRGDSKDAHLFDTKHALAAHFFDRHLPGTLELRRRIEGGTRSLVSFDIAAF